MKVILLNLKKRDLSMKISYCLNLLIVCSIASAIPIEGMSLKKLGFTALAAAVAYKCHRIVRTTQDCNPNSNSLNVLQMFPYFRSDSTVNTQRKTIQEMVSNVNSGNINPNELLRIRKEENDETWQVSKETTVNSKYNDIFIYSRGIATTDEPGSLEKSISIGKKATTIPRNGGGILEAYKYVRDNVINGPCISFDYPDTRGCLNFGQKQEKECLKAVYEQTKKNNPLKKINLVGLCRGAKVAMGLAAECPNAASTLLLESPMLSLQSAANQMGKSYVKWLPYSGALIYNVFRYIFPSYKPEEDNLLKALDTLPNNIPLFIGHLKNDTVVSDESINAFLQKLKKHPNVYLFVLNDTTNTIRHGTLSLTKEFQQASNAFYAAHNVTHNPILAQKGKELLNVAKINAQKNCQQWQSIDHV